MRFSPGLTASHAASSGVSAAVMVASGSAPACDLGLRTGYVGAAAPNPARGAAPDPARDFIP